MRAFEVQVSMSCTYPAPQIWFSRSGDITCTRSAENVVRSPSICVSRTVATMGGEGVVGSQRASQCARLVCDRRELVVSLMAAAIFGWRPIHCWLGHALLTKPFFSCTPTLSGGPMPSVGNGRNHGSMLTVWWVRLTSSSQYRRGIVPWARSWN